MFKKFGWVTIISVFFLIAVGSIVRSTGAGMGCPDWPKCFDQYVPPTNVNQLPSNYMEKITAARIKKNAKLIKILGWLGFSSTVEKLKKHDLNKPIPFSVTKAWIEYINRLIGVLIGLFIFLTMIFSFKYRKLDSKVVLFSVLAFVFVGIEGFLGSLVVSTNLLPGLISFHMILALVIVCMLIYTVARVEVLEQKQSRQQSSNLNFLLLGTLVSITAQLIVGTFVRERVDTLFHNGLLESSSLMKGLGTQFKWHIVLSVLVTSLTVYTTYKANKLLEDKRLKNINMAIAAMVLLSLLSGVLLYILHIPGPAQPIHLTLACLEIGFVFYLLIQLNSEKLFTKLIAKRNSVVA